MIDLILEYWINSNAGGKVYFIFNVGYLIFGVIFIILMIKLIKILKEYE